MAMRKWSVIEHELKMAQYANDPRMMRYLGEVHERLREQHQQLMQCAEIIDMLVKGREHDIAVMAGMDSLLERTGLKAKLTEIEGDPDETGSTYDLIRGSKDN